MIYELRLGYTSSFVGEDGRDYGKHVGDNIVYVRRSLKRAGHVIVYPPATPFATPLADAPSSSPTGVRNYFTRYGTAGE